MSLRSWKLINEGQKAEDEHKRKCGDLIAGRKGRK